MNTSYSVISAAGQRLKYNLPVIVAISSLVAGLGYQAQAQISGVSYTVTPAAEYMRLDPDGAIDGGFFVGGRVGFGFGEIIELGGVYNRGIGLASNLEIGGVESSSIPSRDVNMARYGGEIKANLLKGRYNPFVSAGTGILSVNPAGVEKTETIYLGLATGVQFRVRDRYTANVQISTTSYRYNPVATLLTVEEVSTLGIDPASTENVSIRNFGARVGLQVYLGGQATGQASATDRALREQFGNGLRGLSIQVEPIGSTVNFDQELGLRDKQRFVGASLGMVVGPYFDIRTFFWRGVEEGSWTKFDKLNAYGGELRFKFENFTGSVVPYVMLGGGYLDVLDDYQGNGIAEASSRSFAMAGAGIGLPLGNAVILNGGVRTLLMSVDGLSDSSLKGSVQSNTGYSAGISFGVGRNNPKYDGLLGTKSDESLERDMEIVRMRYELDQAIARTDSLAKKINVPVAPIVFDSTLMAKGGSSAAKTTATKVSPEGSVGATPAPAPQGASHIMTDPSGRWVTLPVPTEGELYLRYGRPGGVTMESYNGGQVVAWYDPNTGEIISGSQGGFQTGAIPGSPNSGQASMSMAQVESMMRKILREESSDSVSTGDAVVTATDLEAMIRRVMNEERLRDRNVVARDTSASVVVPSVTIPIKQVSIPADSLKKVPDSTSTSVQPDSTVAPGESIGNFLVPNGRSEDEKRAEPISDAIPGQRLLENSAKNGTKKISVALTPSNKPAVAN